MKRTIFTDILKDEEGVSLTEFGLISPALFVMLMGTLDVGHTLYTQSIINGAMQTAGRNSSLEGGAVTSEQSLIDNRLKDVIKNVVPKADVRIKRRYYKTFAEAALAEAEDWTDLDEDGTCNDGEPYVDANLNEEWDEDGGNDGQGGARDVVIITAEVKYKRLFPMYGLLGLPNDITFISDSILANQPYGEQADYGTSIVRNCT